MALVTKIQDANAEIDKLKDIIKSAHLALMTCKQRRVGKEAFCSIVQSYDNTKVKAALEKIVENQVDAAADHIEDILNKAQRHVHH